MSAKTVARNPVLWAVIISFISFIWLTASMSAREETRTEEVIPEPISVLAVGTVDRQKLDRAVELRGMEYYPEFSGQDEDRYTEVWQPVAEPVDGEEFDSSGQLVGK